MGNKGEDESAWARMGSKSRLIGLATCDIPSQMERLVIYKHRDIRDVFLEPVPECKLSTDIYIPSKLTLGSMDIAMLM